MSREKIGRNDPCPCGSGQKYKRCCLGGGQPIPGLASFFNVQPGHTAMRSTVESLLLEAQSARHDAHLSQESTTVEAFLEADLVLALFKLKPASASNALRKKWSILFRDRPFLPWENALPHALHVFDRIDDKSPGIQSSARIRFGLEIGRVRDMGRADGSSLSTRELHQAFMNTCATRPLFRIAIAAMERFGTTMSGAYETRSEAKHIYEAIVRSDVCNNAIPLHGYWRTPASQEKNFAQFEALIVTIGEGTRTVAVSLDSGRFFYPGTRALLEALSPFLEKSGLASWNSSDQDSCAQRAEMLLGLLCDPFFIHVFLRYAHEREDAERQALLRCLSEQVVGHLSSTGERVTAANFARLIPSACSNSPWFRAFLAGVRTNNEDGQALREAFTPLWDTAIKNAALKGFPMANSIFLALGAPRPKRIAKKPGANAHAPGMRRLGLWRARRGEASGATLSETKLLTAVAQLNSEATKALSDRGLPLSLLPVISFLQQEGAPEAQFVALSRALLLHPKVLERPWKHVRDVIVWALAQALAAHYEEQSLKGKAALAGHGGLGSTSTGESPWILACRRLCLRAELQVHQGRMDSVPSEAWLGRENLDDDERRFLEKVDKLLNLTASANEHEASLAMERAQQLLGRRRIELRGKETGGVGPSHAPRPYVSITLSLGAKKIETVTGAIGSLLMEHYAVSVIWGWEYDPAEGCDSSMTLTLVGRKENVLLAEHVFDFLCQQAETLWQRARKEQGFEARMRVSFQYGLIQGFSSKLAKARQERQAQDLSADSSIALVRLDEADLAAHMRELFPEQTNKTASTFKVHAEGLAAGKAEGKRLSIHAPVTSASKESEANSPRMLGG